jgi:flagellar FliL protein
MAAAQAAAVADDIEAEGEGEASAPKKKSGSKKKLIIIVAAVLLLAGGGAGAFMSGMLDSLIGGGAAAEGEAAAAAAAEPAGGVFYDLPEMLVNLTTSGKKLGFLKLRVALEVSDEEEKAALEAVQPRIIDSFQIYLRGLRMEDLNGSAGLYRLREELLMRVNAAAEPTKVKDVLFKEMLVQ